MPLGEGSGGVFWRQSGEPFQLHGGELSPSHCEWGQAGFGGEGVRVGETDAAGYHPGAFVLFCLEPGPHGGCGVGGVEGGSVVGHTADVGDVGRP